MLVLTRKAGQQVVLPEHGITIDVVEYRITIGNDDDKALCGIGAKPVQST